jgi:hypothetical protein
MQSSRPRSWRVYGAYLAALAAIAISFATMIASDLMLTEHYNLRGPVLALRWLAAAVAAAVVAAPWAALAWWSARGLGRGQRVGALLLCWLVSLPAAHFGLDAANVVLATSEARTHTVAFVRSETVRKGSGYSVISSWEEPGATVRLTTNLRSGLLTPGAPIEVDVRRGALGWTYIASVRPPPRSD